MCGLSPRVVVDVGPVHLAVRRGAQDSPTRRIGVGGCEEIVYLIPQARTQARKVSHPEKAVTILQVLKALRGEDGWERRVSRTTHVVTAHTPLHIMR